MTCSTVFFNSLARSRYLSFFLTFFQFYSVATRDSKVDYFASSFFFLIIIKSGLLTGIRRSVCMLKSHRSLCVAFSRTGAGLCIYHYYYYFYYYYYSFRVFHISFIWSSFTRVWVGSKFPQVSRTLLSILAVLSHAIIWMVSTRPPTSKSFNPFNNPLVTVPKEPITIGIIVTFIFHNFSIPQQGRGIYPCFHILLVLFCGQPRQQNRQFCKFSFFFCWLLLSVLLNSFSSFSHQP